MTTAPTPDIVFLTVPNLLTCSEVTIQWTFNATTPSTSDHYPLVVTNIGIDQGGLDRREHPLVARQTTAAVNTTLTVIDVSTGKFDWPKVNIPQGWYRMNIYATAEAIPSNIFNVTNGLDVSCVVTPSQSSIPPSSSTSPATPTSTGSPSSINSPSVTTSPLVVGNSSVKTGAIAGGAAGGVVVLLLIVAIVVRLSRRRRARTRNKGQTFRGHRSQLDSKMEIPPFDVEGKQACQFSNPEDYAPAPEKIAVAEDHTLPTLPLTPGLYSKSSASSNRPTSVIRPSFDSEQVRPRPSTSPPYSQSRGQRTTRKPVPAYDPDEFPTNGSNSIPLSCPPGTIQGGGGRYLIYPDLPHPPRQSD